MKRSLVRIQVDIGQDPNEILVKITNSQPKKFDENFGLQDIDPENGVYMLKTIDEISTDEILKLEGLNDVKVFYDNPIDILSKDSDDE